MDDTRAFLTPEAPMPPTADDRQPEPRKPTYEEVYAEIERVLNCKVKPLFTCKHTPSLDELRRENERLRAILALILPGCRVEQHKVKELYYDPPDGSERVVFRCYDDCPVCLGNKALTPKGPTP
jgi:hypothetical protein